MAFRAIGYHADMSAPEAGIWTQIHRRNRELRRAAVFSVMALGALFLVAIECAADRSSFVVNCMAKTARPN